MLKFSTRRLIPSSPRFPSQTNFARKFWSRGRPSCQPRSPKVRERRWPRKGGPTCRPAGKWKCPQLQRPPSRQSSKLRTRRLAGRPAARSPSADQHNKSSTLANLPRVWLRRSQGLSWGRSPALPPLNWAPVQGSFVTPECSFAFAWGETSTFPPRHPGVLLKSPFSPWVQEFSAAAKLEAGFRRWKDPTLPRKKLEREGGYCLKGGGSNEVHQAWRESCFAPFFCSETLAF